MLTCFQLLLSLGMVCSGQTGHGHSRVFPWPIGSKEDLGGIFHSAGLPLALTPILSPPNQWSPFCYFSLHFLELYMNGILQYGLFFIWFLLLSIIILRFIPVEAGKNKQFTSFVVELNPIVYIQPWFLKSINLYIWVVFILWPLNVKLLWTFMYKYLYGCKFSVLLDKY